MSRFWLARINRPTPSGAGHLATVVDGRVVLLHEQTQHLERCHAPIAHAQHRELEDTLTQNSQGWPTLCNLAQLFD